MFIFTETHRIVTKRHLSYEIRHNVTVTWHLTQVNVPHLKPSQVGLYSIYVPQRDARLSWPV